VEEDLTIYSAAAAKEALLSKVAANAGAPFALDMERVAEIDTAGVQLLLITLNIAAQAGGGVTLVKVRPAVLETLRLLRLESKFMARVEGP
jgi:anti-anti-sigma factor